MRQKYLRSCLILLTLTLLSQVAPAQCLTWNATPNGAENVCDNSVNDPALWKNASFYDQLHASLDLAETPWDATFTVDHTACGAAPVTVSFVLLLDLNNDGVRETAVTGDPALPPGQLRFGNALNGPSGYATEGTLVTFDSRPVPDEERYRFVVETTTANGITTARLRWTTDATPGVFSVPQLPVGQQQIAWTATSNSQTATQTLNLAVVDCLPPTVICQNMLSINVLPTGKVEVWTSDFLQYKEDNITPSNQIEVSIRRTGTGTGFPLTASGGTQDSLQLTCAELGIRSLELWVRDRAGNTAYCQTFVFLQNLGFSCTGDLGQLIQYSNPTTCGDSTYLFANTTDAVDPNFLATYEYEWSNGATTPYLYNPTPGVYGVTLKMTGITVPGLTLNFFDSIELTAEDFPADCGGVVGSVRIDAGEDCTPTPDEASLAGVLVAIDNGAGGVWYTTSDATGAYSAFLPPDTYTVSAFAPSGVWVACPGATVQLLESQNTSLDLSIDALIECPQLNVQLSTPLLRRCFNTAAALSYSNDGTSTAEDAYIDLTLDPLLTLVEAGQPFTDLGNHVYRFELGDVPLNGSGNISLLVNVSCAAALGQTHCSSAHIYPDSLCLPPSPLWSGASLALETECEGDSVRFTVRNVGTGPMSGPLEYIVIEDFVMFKAGQITPLAPNGTMDVKVLANGSTWHMNVGQEPNHPGHSMPSLSVEGCPTIAPGSTGLVNVFPLDDADKGLDLECQQNVGSYDPNDKQGFPTGYGPQHYIRPGTDLEYLIRFQNTGTDTAFTVVIRDTLSAWLDPATLVPGPASHPYRFEFYGEGPNIKFTFDPINLPDSSDNLAASQGFVSFRISQRAGVPLETDILNTAAIYFDFNDPIFTNTTQHRVGEQFVEVAAWEPQKPAFRLEIAPNPANEATWLSVQGLPADVVCRFEITDALGQVVRSGQAAVGSSRWQFVRGHLPAGAYTVRVTSADGQRVGVGKLLLR